MSEIDLFSLGEVFKELRVARGLKLKDISSNHLSISQLSKFENGQSMLSADKLILALSGINMTFAEFGHVMNNYKDSVFNKRILMALNYQKNMNIDGLRLLLNETSKLESYPNYTILNNIVIECAILSIEPNYQISKYAQEIVTKYLYSIEEWTNYELHVFGNTMQILSINDLIFLGKAFVERDKFYKYLPQNKKNACMVLVNIIMILVENKEFYHSLFFIKKLESLITYQDMFIIIFLNFIKKNSCLFSK